MRAMRERPVGESVRARLLQPPRAATCRGDGWHVPLGASMGEDLNRMHVHRADHPARQQPRRPRTGDRLVCPGPVVD